MTKNLNSFYMALLLIVTSAAHAEIQLGQDKVKLLEKYQIELHELKIKVVQLETEVFLGGYNDLIERYQEIIQQLEYDIKQADSFSKSYSSFVKQLQVQKAEIDDLNSSVIRNNFFLLISALFSMLAVARATN